MAQGSWGGALRVPTRNVTGDGAGGHLVPLGSSCSLTLGGDWIGWESFPTYRFGRPEVLQRGVRGIARGQPGAQSSESLAPM